MDRCKDTSGDKCKGVRIGRCIDMCLGLCNDIRGMGTSICIGMCIDMTLHTERRAQVDPSIAVQVAPHGATAVILCKDVCRYAQG